MQEAPTEGRRERDKVRHSEDRRGRKLDFEAETRRANNEYLVHERQGRRARSDRPGRSRGEVNGEAEPEKSNGGVPDIQEILRSLGASGGKARKPRQRDSHEPDDGRARGFVDVASSRTILEEMDRLLGQSSAEHEDSGRRRSARRRRNPKLEDFQVDMDDFAQMRQYWAPEFDQDSGNSGIIQTQQDYFGDYEVEERPRKRSPQYDGLFLTYRDLVRIKRDLEGQDAGRDEDLAEKREKREEEEPRCNSDVTTLTVGCSTADRMEFQSDCVDDDAVTGQSEDINDFTSLTFGVLGPPAFRLHVPLHTDVR